MKTFDAAEFSPGKAWASDMLADFGDVTARLYFSDESFRWHANNGPEVFVVLDGCVDMHVREAGIDRVVPLVAGQGMAFEDGDEHVAHPVGAARFLVVERRDSE